MAACACVCVFRVARVRWTLLIVRRSTHCCVEFDNRGPLVKHWLLCDAQKVRASTAAHSAREAAARGTRRSKQNERRSAHHVPSVRHPDASSAVNLHTAAGCEWPNQPEELGGPTPMRQCRMICLRLEAQAIQEPGARPQARARARACGLSTSLVPLLDLALTTSAIISDLQEYFGQKWGGGSVGAVCVKAGCEKKLGGCRPKHGFRRPRSSRLFAARKCSWSSLFRRVIHPNAFKPTQFAPRPTLRTVKLARPLQDPRPPSSSPF